MLFKKVYEPKKSACVSQREKLLTKGYPTVRMTVSFLFLYTYTLYYTIITISFLYFFKLHKYIIVYCE